MLKLGFFFNAQLHHVFHAMPLALALSRDPRFDVHVIALTEDHIALAREIAEEGQAGPITYTKVKNAYLTKLQKLVGTRTPPKVPALMAARGILGTCDAIVVPERTSLLLRSMGLNHVTFIHTCHGAGDRAVGYDSRIKQFDFVLLAGEKQRDRMLEMGLIREGHYAIVGYGKFDLVKHRKAIRLFDNDRPVVLYNPHFSKQLSSWPSMGMDIVRQFARSDRYNLIVAPHIRMFDKLRQRAKTEQELAPYASLPHIHVDLGSPASVDMRYAEQADAYLGDVSSQVYEFVVRPRPCVFLNAHQVQWQSDINYRHWQYGHVFDNASGIVDKVSQAFALFPQFRRAQEEGVAHTFIEADGKVADNAGRIVAEFLLNQQDKQVQS